MANLFDDDDTFSFDAATEGLRPTSMPSTGPLAAAMPMPGGTATPPDQKIDTPSFTDMPTGFEAPEVGASQPSYAGQPGAPAPGSAAPSPTATAGGPTTAAPNRQKHVELLSQIRGTSDPRQKAVLQDQLGRSLFAEFKAAGHDVKWSSDNTLVIDGRSYVLGGDTVPGEVGEAAQPMTTADGGGGLGFDGRYGTMPGSGYDAAKWNDPNSDSAKYLFGRSIDYDAMRQIPDEAGRKAFLAQEVRRVTPLLKAKGWTIHEVTGDGVVISGHGYPPGFVDLVGDIEGAATPAYIDDAGRAGGGGGPIPFDPRTPITPMQGPRPSYDPGPAAGAPPPGAPGWTPNTGPLYTPGEIPLDDIPRFSYEDLLRDMQLDKFAPLDEGYTTGRLAETPADFGRVDDDYTAGAISNDPANYGRVDDAYEAGDLTNDPANFGRVDDDYAAGRIVADPAAFGRVDDDYAAGRIAATPSTFGRVEDAYTAGAVANRPLDEYSFEGFGDDLGDLGAGGTDAQTEALVADILENPESYPPQVVAMLKARSKDELADMATQEDEDLLAQGFLTGNQDSNWLASERLAAQGRRDQSLVASNRAIDLEAAAANTADRRAAAGVGLSYADSKDSRNRANRAQRFNEAAAGEGFEQDVIASKNRGSQFAREGELTNEQLRAEAFDRRAASQRANIATRQNEASFDRGAELENERLRGEAADRRTAGQRSNIDTRRAEASYDREAELENERLRESAFDRRAASQRANIATRQDEASYNREGELQEERLRGEAFDRRTAGQRANIATRQDEASYNRAGELENERLREGAFDRRTASQRANIDTRQNEAAFDRAGALENERLRGDAFDRRNAARQQNIDNLFKSSQEKRAAVALASDQALKAAAMRGDRMALQESLKQKAAELGISRDQVMSQWLLGLMDDATRRHGIDVGASIDRARLDQQSEQWKEELAYRLAALAQANEQFGAGYGLDYARFLRDVDNDNYGRYRDSFSFDEA